MALEDELFQMELNLHPNEASGLLMIGNRELLGEHGWDLGSHVGGKDGPLQAKPEACHAMTALPPSETTSRRRLPGSPQRGYPG